MNANDSPTASLSPSTSSRRSLFSRLTSPLRARARNLTDFHIRPNDPHRQYSPGDLVTGAVVLTVVKPIRITHLTVCLHGFVRVFKHPGGANELLPVDAGLTAGSNPRKTQYFGNGHASLFQDEVTLCGEGRLEAGVYEFNFELEFPRKGLPTSIDFERGTISYMISSTVTRPTSIAATSTCDQKVSLVETVDIGPMLPPKPRTISLEPISRRTRRVRTIKNKENGSQPSKDGKEVSPGSETTGETGGSPLPDDSASQCGSADHQNTRNNAPNDMQSSVSAANSADSTTSTTSFRVAVTSARSTKDSQQSSEKSPVSDKTITATIELLKAGCLPGESLPLKINIKHTKAIKSMHGIIITLYRQGRIDSAPPLSLFVDITGKEAERLKHEEYYPKSKTGLSGLSLTSAGSSSLFRKDLAQTFAPILVDPTTFTSVVNASVRVPEDAFPTITGVPGQMIDFKYHIEVVIDLGGKLAGQERHIPRVGTLTLPNNFGTPGRSDANTNMLSTWGGSIVDTDHIRREKSVVTCVFDIIVGTTDSARKRGRGNSVMTRKQSDYEAIYPNPQTPIPPTHEPIYEEEPPNMTYDQNGNHHDQPYPYQYYDENYQEYYYDDGHNYQHYPDHQHPAPPSHADIHVPPPEIQADEHLTEKDRMRRAEERLLPSQPPQESAGSSSSIPPTDAMATAPSVLTSHPEEDLYGDGDDAVTPVPPHLTASRTLSHHSHHHYQQQQEASAPPFSDLSNLPSAPPPQDTASSSSDDKQELERRRLMAEASAPSDIPDDGDNNDNAGEGSSRALRRDEGATAPVIDEEEDYLRGGVAHRHGESLPRYER